MRILLLTLLPFFAFGQSVEFIEIDSTWYLVEMIQVDNGEGRPDTRIDTIQLGDTGAAISYGKRRRQQSLREYDRLRKRLYDGDFAAMDRRWVNAMEAMSYDADSTETARRYQSVFPDTVRLTFPASRIPLIDLGDYTKLLSPAGDLELELYPFITGAGNLQLRSTTTPGRWRVIINSPQDFELRQFLGENINLFLADDRRNRRVFVEDNPDKNESVKAVIRVNQFPIIF